MMLGQSNGQCCFLSGRRALALFFATALALSSAHAARLSGTVFKQDNQAASDAHVLVSGPIATGHVVVRTDHEGRFEVRSLPPGAFTVEVVLEGYFPLVQTIEIAQSDVELELALAPREVRQAVDVVETISGVDPQQTAKVRMLSHEQIDKVPFAPAYDFQKALAILPGVGLDRLGRVHVNGGSTDQLLYMLDGFNLTSPVTGGLENTVNVDAIQTADVRSSGYSAEYGKASAGVISVVTRSGDDRFRQHATDFIPSFDRKAGTGVFLKDWAPRFVLAGPVKRGRVWFLNSLDAKYDLDVIPGLPQDANQSSMWRVSDVLRVQAQLGPSHLVSATVFHNRAEGRHLGLDLFTPMETTRNLRARGTFLSIKDQRFTHGLLAEFGFATNHLILRKEPMGDQLFILEPDSYHGNYFLRTNREAQRDEGMMNLAPSPLYAWGRHELKLGFTFDRILYRQRVQRHPYETRLVHGVPWRRTEFTGGSWYSRNNLEWGGYAQDRWSPVPRFLIEGGIRQDWDRIVHHSMFSPRLAFAFVPFAGRQFKLSTGFGVFHDSTNLSAIARTLDQRQYDTFYHPDGTVAFGPAETVFQMPGVPLRAPRVLNWSSGWEQKLASGLSVRATYMQRLGSFGYTFRNLLAAPLPGRYALYEMQNSRRDRYRAVEFTVSQSPAETAYWNASYVHSSTWANNVVDYTIENAFFQGQGAGPLDWDAPNRLVSSGWVQVKKEWTLSWLGDWRDGMPFSVINAHQELVGRPNSMRYPDFFSLNVHVERKLRTGRYRWAVRAGVNNVTGHDNFSTVNNNTDSANFRKFGAAERRSYTFRLRYMGKD